MSTNRTICHPTIVAYKQAVVLGCRRLQGVSANVLEQKFLHWWELVWRIKHSEGEERNEYIEFQHPQTLACIIHNKLTSNCMKIAWTAETSGRPLHKNFNFDSMIVLNSPISDLCLFDSSVITTPSAALSLLFGFATHSTLGRTKFEYIDFEEVSSVALIASDSVAATKLLASSLIDGIGIEWNWTFDKLYSSLSLKRLNVQFCGCIDEYRSVGGSLRQLPVSWVQLIHSLVHWDYFDHQL